MAQVIPHQVELPGIGRGWLKRYGGGTRRWRLWLLNRVVDWLGVPSLRAAPSRTGEALRLLEQRRLAQLADHQVRVPAVLCSNANELLLADLGPTLASRMRAADPAERLRLLARASAAIAGVHAQGASLGQPLARNITVDDAGQIGFLDFEDDPLEVMTLAQAQCRDWLLFAGGSLRHAPEATVAELAAALASGIADASDPVREELARSLQRLQLIGHLSARLGRRARGISLAIESLQVSLAEY